MTKAVNCFDILGMWGKMGTDPAMFSITDDLKKQGYNTHNSPYDDADPKVYDDALATAVDELLVIIGASLGGNNGPAFAKGLEIRNRIVDLLVGFQPSTYGAHVPVPKNCKLAICIWNPVWLLTLGLGNYEWTLADDNPATIELSKDNGATWATYKHGTNGNILRIIENLDVHPGDFNMSVRDYIYNVIRHLRYEA